LVIDRVGRDYDDGAIVALNDVSLSLGRRELLALHGPNGSGKSTLLNMMAGLDQPTRGSVTVNGCRSPNTEEWSRLRAGVIGIVFQDFNLLPTLTASENIQIAMFGTSSPAERARRATDLLREVGIDHCADRFPPELSGGERQRISIARSLSNGPALLLADEPTSNLDTKAGAAVVDLLLDLQKTRDLAMVIVTHDRAVRERCPRMVGMQDGRIVEDVRG
jgi:putative ABC transport system ATP-binding protein